MKQWDRKLNYIWIANKTRHSLGKQTFFDQLKHLLDVGYCVLECITKKSLQNRSA